jgi:prephenate dehydratase
MDDYNDLAVTTANLNELGKRQKALSERRLAHLRELAQSLLNSEQCEPDVDTLRALLAKLPDQETADHGILAVNRQPIEAYTGGQRITEQILLCRELLRSGSKLLSEPMDWLLSANGGAPSRGSPTVRVAFAQSRYTDAALRQFTRHGAFLQRTPLPVYTGSFPAACEEVAAESCDACILPLENSAEGSFAGFYAMIERYDLKITATCDVLLPDTAQTTRYALLRRTFPPDWSEPPALRTPKFLEFSIIPKEDQALADVLTAARICGLPLRRLDSIPLPYKEGAFAFYPVFGVSGDGLLPFLLYLALAYPQFTPLGVYPHLGETEVT